jgi:O-antigen ligase
MSQAALSLAFITWLVSLPSTGWRPLSRFRFMIPFSLFAVLSLVTVIFSYNPIESLWYARNLLLFLAVPLIIQVVRREQDVRALIAALGAGALITTLWGVFQVFTAAGGGVSHRRLTGMLGHYMTAGGVLMLASMMTGAVVLHARRRWVRVLAGITTLVLLAGVGLTQSRNAYLGVAAGLVALVLLWRKGLVYLLPFVLSLAVLVSPPIVRDRMFSIVNLEDQSIQNRFNMVETGARMVADFPLFGVGMSQVKPLYNRFKSEDDPGFVPHLHNNLIQIAAERGLPAMILWVWLMVALAAGHLRLADRRRAPPWVKIAAVGALAAVVALFVAGLFEYNFGDGEVQMVFFVAVAIPFALGYPERNNTRKENGIESHAPMRSA